jgi:hypothetical protein
MTLRLGDSNILLQPLCEYLGDDFVLESALVITVDPATEAQNAHTDTDGGERVWRDGLPLETNPAQKKTDTSFASPSSTKWTFFSPKKTVESAAIPSPGRRGQPLSARSLTAASRDLRAAVLLPPDTEREALHAVHAVGSSVIFMVILW